MPKFYINIKNPLNTWRQMKFLFKKPVKKWIWGRPQFFCYGSWLTIETRDMQYKMKFDEPRFEYPPMIQIIFFNRWGLTIVYQNPSKFLAEQWLDDIYWQMLARTVDLNESVSSAAENESGWTLHDGETILRTLTAKEIIETISKF